MPKSKPPADPNQAARSILDQITGEKRKVAPVEKNGAAVELGRKGGEARKAALPAEERKRIAQEAARKRWGPSEGDGVE